MLPANLVEDRPLNRSRTDVSTAMPASSCSASWCRSFRQTDEEDIQQHICPPPACLRRIVVDVALRQDIVKVASTLQAYGEVANIVRP